MCPLTCGHIQHMYSWWWVGLSPETCRVKAFAKNKTQLLHLIGIIFTTMSRAFTLVVLANLLSCSYKHDLHLPSTSLTLVQRGVLHSGSKIFSHLPHHIKKLSNNFKSFKSGLKTFLIENTCYSIEEFFQIQSETG